MLTHRWKVYPKEGSSGYASINLQNFQLVFTNEQLASSLSTFWLPALWGSLIMDTERLQADIVSSLQLDLMALAHLSNKANPHWSTSPDGLFQQDDCIYICPGFQNIVAMHPPVCSCSPLIWPLRPIQDPSPSPTPLYLARTPEVHQTLLQVMHNLLLSQAMVAQAIWIAETASSTRMALELNFH